MENEFKEDTTFIGKKYLILVYILISVLYLIWRIEVSRAWVAWYTYPVLILETYSIINTFLFLISSCRILHPVWKTPLKNKTVDALIPTLNEPEYIVKMTAIGALHIKGIRHVYILDDGNRNNIREMAQKIGARYLARTDKLHAKAGNMNYGLLHSDAEFIISLDCDHVPQNNFIERTLGYFSDEKLAFVQTPQLFYNTDSLQFRKLSFRNYWNEQSMFYESIQPGKNAFNASFFCGSGAILRRSAIDSVAGFATGTATEDIHTSLRLHAKGWKSLFLSEKLAYGIAPEDLQEYHKQHVRWGAGSLGLLFRSSDSPLAAKGLSLMQRICYFHSTSYFLNGIQKLFYFLLPISILFSLPFVHTQSNIPIALYLAIFLPFWGFSFLVTYIFSNRTFHPVYTEQFNVANILSSLMALKGIVHAQKKFNASTKVKTKKESSAAFTAIVIMWFIMLLANIFGLLYWFVFLKQDFQGLFFSPTVIALFWNSFNLSFITSLIHFLHTYHKKAARMKVAYKCKEFILAGLLKEIDLNGAVFLTNAEILSNNMILTLQIDQTEMNLNTQLTLVKRLSLTEYSYHLTFRDLSRSDEVGLVLYLFNKIVPGIYKNDFIKARSVQREKMAGTEPGMVGIERFQDVLEAVIGEEETVKLPPLLRIRPIWEHQTAGLSLL
jgi:cellulose synthase/poly-beta-1,6-N-acetylglucosamine synthase-like glycosyltransferase